MRKYFFLKKGPSSAWGKSPVLCVISGCIAILPILAVPFFDRPVWEFIPAVLATMFIDGGCVYAIDRLSEKFGKEEE